VHPTRRQLLKTAAGILATPALRLSFAQQPTEKLADDLYIVRLPGEAAVVAQTSRDGVLLVDGGSAAGSDAILKAVAALPNGAGKVHTIFNTHWHPEQTGSNEKLGTAGATIIAQENTRLWLQQNITWPWNGQKFKKLSKVAQPNKTFYDKGSLESGVRYGYISDAAHTDGDLYVYFRSRTSWLSVTQRMEKAGPWSIGGQAAGSAVSSADSKESRASAIKTRSSFPPTALYSPTPTSPRNSICTARSTTS
jgi:hypothetical protein